MVPLKHLSNFWRTIEMHLINCEMNLILNCSEKFVIVCKARQSKAIAKQGATFSIIDTKYYVPVVTLSTEDNAKLLQQLESGFKRRINWKKYQSKVSIERPN